MASRDVRRDDDGDRMTDAPTHVAFLRAINVGGHVVKMDRLRALFEALGHGRVETYIASGNVAFAASTRDDAATLEARIERHLHDSLGWPAETFLRTPAELAEVAARRPFDGAAAAAEGAKTSEFVGFLKHAPSADARDRVLAHRSTIDDFVFVGRELHWRVQGSALDSKLTGAKLEKLLGGPVTVRNVTTVRKLAGKYE